MIYLKYYNVHEFIDFIREGPLSPTCTSVVVDRIMLEHSHT
jgi:hypothetical protein